MISVLAYTFMLKTMEPCRTSDCSLCGEAEAGWYIVAAYYRKGDDANEKD